MKTCVTSAEFKHDHLRRATANYILSVQQPNGCIPWFAGGKADPWDHIEAAMGLAVAGEFAAAARAYHWLKQMQLEDGSWWANYLDDQPLDKNHRETNFVAYVATGVWHYFLITQDKHFLRSMFPCVRKAIHFVLRYQSPTGEIYWAVAEDGSAKKDALVTASASIYKSIQCAILCARELNESIDCEHGNGDWLDAYEKLGKALRYHPEYFDRTWEPKTRFSMDWFYPVLAGVVMGAAAQARLNSRWEIFVEDNVGCRCVSDEPWVTVAESCELTLALIAAGDTSRAADLFGWLQQFMDEDGGYWTGFNFRDQVIWPREKTTWTAGVVLLAADALMNLTAAATLFTKHTDIELMAESLQI